MYKVNFKKENIEVYAEENELLLDCIRKSGLKIETPCNSRGFCGKCKVIVSGGLTEPDEQELKFINLKNRERLSCLAKIIGDVEVELIEKDIELKTINKGFSIEVELDSPIKIDYITRDRGSSKPLEEYFNGDLNNYNLYKKIYGLEHDGVDNISMVKFYDSLVDVYDSRILKRIFGVAIDIGTTGISYYLIDLETGEILEKLSSLNPQTEYGGDVITRITYCMENENGCDRLQKVIVDEINISLKKLVSDFGDLDNIYHISIAANTTMIHLLLGINPESLAKAPYRPIFLSPKDMDMKDLGLVGNENGKLSLISAASSYVGGDIVAGIMASDFFNKEDALFIDIGTNGELAALKNGEIISTSTAAGPALEGMNIECGCRAQKGAIESFSIDEDYNITYETIGNTEAIGICGSGLMDIAAAFVKREILGKTGRWNKKMDDRVLHRLRDKKFYISDEIYISQKDIRQIQLAKGAISAGIILMLDELDLELGTIKSAYISGAFGYHINPESILTIGLIPKGFEGEMHFLGNTSLEGARLSLINRACLDKTRELYDEMRVLELSMRESFQDIFVRELSF